MPQHFTVLLVILERDFSHFHSLCVPYVLFSVGIFVLCQSRIRSLNWPPPPPVRLVSYACLQFSFPLPMDNRILIADSQTQQNADLAE